MGANEEAGHRYAQIVGNGDGTDGTPGAWSNFEPNKAQGTFEGPPSYPTDPRGTWSESKTEGGPQQDAEGVYQNGNGNGSWFHRAQGTQGTPETTPRRVPLGRVRVPLRVPLVGVRADHRRGH